MFTVHSLFNSVEHFGVNETILLLLLYYSRTIEYRFFFYFRSSCKFDHVGNKIMVKNDLHTADMIFTDPSQKMRTKTLPLPFAKLY